MTLSRSQIERLGERLVASSPPAPKDLDRLHELLLVYGDALAEAVSRVHVSLGITPTARVKNTGTILEKLERYGGSWLKSIQDIAGMRIVGGFDRTGQDGLITRLVDLFEGGGREPRVVDRRAAPSHGYRAVHVIIFVRSVPVEIQVRTQLQHEWADLFEKLADRIGRGIRYGEPPDDWLMPSQRAALSPLGRKRHMLELTLRVMGVVAAEEVASMIDAYELREASDPQDPDLPLARERVRSALTNLQNDLNHLAFQQR